MTDGTTRQKILDLLTVEPMTAKDVSRALGLPEKDVLHHLPHAAKSAQSAGRRLEIVPSRCLNCGHAFKDRRRYSRPGRCPRCKSVRVTEPAFTVKTGK